MVWRVVSAHRSNFDEGRAVPALRSALRELFRLDLCCLQADCSADESFQIRPRALGRRRISAHPRPPDQDSCHSENRKRGRRAPAGRRARGVFRLASASRAKTHPMKLWLVISLLWTISVVGALAFVIFAH